MSSQTLLTAIWHLWRVTRSACDHAHKHAVLAREMMVEGCRDMGDNKTCNGEGDPSVNRKEPFRQSAFRGPDRRQLEPAEYHNCRGISRRRGPADEGLCDQESVEAPVRRG